MESTRSFIREAGAVLAAVLRPGIRSIRQNSGLAVLSIGLAFALWIFVTHAENPTTTRVVPVDLPVQPVNVSSDAVVQNALSPGRRRVSVASDVFSSLSAADFQATVDLDGLGVGHYEPLVQVRALSTRGSLRVIEVLPATPATKCSGCIAVDLTLLSSKEVPVIINVTGEPAGGFTMSAPQTKDQTAVASGPRDKVDRVNEAVGTVNVTGRTETVEQAVHLQPLDQGGTLVEKVDLKPALTNIKVEIDQTVFSRPVVVAPKVTGSPAKGYNVTSISSDPATITISGAPDFINAVNSMATKPLGVDDADHDVVKTISLELPEGQNVTVIGSATVTVTVKIAAANGEVRFGVPVTPQNLGGGLSVAGAFPNVEVSITGPMPDLLRLAAKDISASVDLDGKDAGTYKLKVKVDVPQAVRGDAISASPQEIELTLERS